MDKNQVKRSASEAQGKTKEGAKRANQGDKSGAVLRDINGDTKKATKSTKKEAK